MAQEDRLTGGIFARHRIIYGPQQKCYDSVNLLRVHVVGAHERSVRMDVSKDFCEPRTLQGVVHDIRPVSAGITVISQYGFYRAPQYKTQNRALFYLYLFQT